MGINSVIQEIQASWVTTNALPKREFLVVAFFGHEGCSARNGLEVSRICKFFLETEISLQRLKIESELQAAERSGLPKTSPRTPEAAMRAGKSCQDL